MTMYERAKYELTQAGYLDKDGDYGGMVGTAVLELLDVFRNQGHSGGSAAFVSTLFKKLVDGEVLTELTGADEEWEKVGLNRYQNKRMTSVFKDSKDDQAYHIYGKIYVRPDGGQRHEFTPVNFPCIPKSEVIYVNE